jgi:hypothetical protein
MADVVNKFSKEELAQVTALEQRMTELQIDLAAVYEKHSQPGSADIPGLDLVALLAWLIHNRRYATLGEIDRVAQKYLLGDDVLDEAEGESQ